MDNVYINGFSAVCAQGDNCHEIISNILFHPRKPKLIPLNTSSESLSVNYFPAFDKKRLSLTEIVDRIVFQILQTLQACQWQESELEQIPIFLASTSFAMSSHEITFFNKELLELTEACYHQPFSLNEIAEQLKLKWKNLDVINVATSCTSSSNALLYAKNYISQGIIERAIIVGFESFNSITLEGFNALGLLTNNYQPPFLSVSQGLILGEGIGCIALSNQPRLANNNQFILKGGKTICDTSNITTTDPKNVSALIKDTLTQFDMTETDIVAIKTHATGSPMNDKVEIDSLTNAFTERKPLIFFKPYLGHTLGASGVLEMIILLLIFESKQTPSYPNYHMAQSEPIYTNGFTDISKPYPQGYYLLNCIGFGGNNAVLLLEITE